MRSLTDAAKLARTPHPSGLCRICFIRNPAPGWATCTPCFFAPQRWAIPCACTTWCCEPCATNGGHTDACPANRNAHGGAA